MNESLTLPKNPQVPPSLDYYFLRQKGIEYIEQLGSKFWNHYNPSEPGITILEAAAYALTELGYRANFNIKDLLAPSLATGGEDQGFFTARKILTTYPVTVRDFRKLLVDLTGIRNAWLVCKTCACEVEIYGDCKKSELTYARTEHAVIPTGTYDVWLEMDEDPELGDFNNGKIKHRFSVFQVAGNPFISMLLEIRFPSWQEVENQHERFSRFLQADSLIKNGGITVTKLTKIEAPTTNLLGTTLPPRAFRNPLLASLKVTFLPDPHQPAIEETLVLENVPFTVFQEEGDHRKQIALQDFVDELENTATGILKNYHGKLKKANALIEQAKATLHVHRNLDEDFCRVTTVAVEDLAVCADVELKPDADIEKVLATIYFEIDQYFNPPLRFYTLQELLHAGMPTDEIFNGPALEHGFLRTDELEASQIRGQVYTSDIINRLVEIEGVVAVSNLLLTKYDAQGRAIMPSQPWKMDISFQHQPRLYMEQSKIMFFKNGLPFLPNNPQEVWATLQQLKSTTEAVKRINHEKDLPVPTGTVRELGDYFPLQYSFPLTYGIGFEGLPETATALRKAQAKQLKAYLLFYEQMLVNYLAQLQHFPDLFVLDAKQQRSLFTTYLSPDTIRGVEELYVKNSSAPPPEFLIQDALPGLIETEEQGVVRRNTFLDHLLGRFAEQFTDYALMLYSVQVDDANPNTLTFTKQVHKTLLQNKVNFLKEYPESSATRFKAFNYLAGPTVCDPANRSGMQRRIHRLLGLQPADHWFVVEHVLLRPRFYGQALMPVCLAADCEMCGEEDPYSFRLTLVMPGWLNQFRNVDFRRFAERTIRLETPAHLLVKICWVGNEVCRGEGDNGILCLLNQALTSQLVDASKQNFLALAICRFAETVLDAYNAAFRDAYVSKDFQALSDTDLEQLFNDHIRPLPLPIELAAALHATYPDALRTTLTGYFKGKEACFQFNSFRKAWCEWLTEMNRLDRNETALYQQVEKLMKAQLQAAGIGFKPENVCECTRRLLETFGDALREWLKKETNIRAARTAPEWQTQVEDLFTQSISRPAFNCAFSLPTAFFDALKIRLVAYYHNKLALLQKHAALLRIMGQLKSIYPPATLHDCEDGNDDNPVRLDATMLG